MIITDDIGNTGAARPFGSLGHRAVLAASAGADLILCAATEPGPDSSAPASVARRALVAALRRHQLGLGATRASVARVLALRAHP